MDMYDLSGVKLNCNVAIPVIKRVVNAPDEKIYVLNRIMTKSFHLPTVDGVIRFKYYDMDYITDIKYGCLHIHIKMKPFPIYNTVWIEFCKAISHIIEHKNITYVQPTVIRTKIYSVPNAISKHYSIRKFIGKKVQSRRTNRPFRNYPRQLVTRVGHYRKYDDKTIFIKEQIVPTVKINKAQGIRIG